MQVFGLTGGIATGKSAVEALLRERGVPVLDADQYARKVVEPGTPGWSELRAAFGPEVFDGEGRLDRAQLGKRVFGDLEARRQLEAITHPRIYQAMAEDLARLADGGHEIAVVSAALMVETGSYQNYSGLLVVNCSSETQRARLMARDSIRPEEAEARITSQMPLAEKARRADRIIDNDGPLTSLPPQVDAAVAWMKAGLDS